MSIMTQRILKWGLNRTYAQNHMDELETLMRKADVDITKQYTEKFDYDDYYRLKLRNQHCFQIGFTKKNLGLMLGDKKYCTIVDIGDSSGNHLRYLRTILEAEGVKLDGISVNLDETAVDKINASGGKAVLCRAEEYDAGTEIDCYLSFEMVEHLHNPALFFYKLAKSNHSKYIIITVPYVNSSRCGLHYSYDNEDTPITAEQEHIFELSPLDWERLAFHSGWKLLDKEIYYQYPKKYGLLSYFLKRLWMKNDYEGFLALSFEREMTVADRYTDWED